VSTVRLPKTWPTQDTRGTWNLLFGQQRRALERGGHSRSRRLIEKPHRDFSAAEWIKWSIVFLRQGGILSNGGRPRLVRWQLPHRKQRASVFSGWIRPLNVCGLLTLSLSGNADRLVWTRQDICSDGTDDFHALFAWKGRSTRVHSDQTFELDAGEQPLCAAPFECVSIWDESIGSPHNAHGFPWRWPP